MQLCMHTAVHAGTRLITHTIHIPCAQVQGRGSLHAHIILWLHPDDVSRVQGEITAHVPAPYDHVTRSYNEDGHSLTDKVLTRLVLNKQQHRCTDLKQPGCRPDGHCRYHFPSQQHTSRTPQWNASTNRYQYYCPRDVDRNTVPYHPTVSARAMHAAPQYAP